MCLVYNIEDIVTVQPTAKVQRTQSKNFKKEENSSQKNYLL